MNMNEERVQQSIQNPTASSNNHITSESLTALLNSLFPEQEQDKELRQIKAILGNLANEFTTDEVHTLLCEIRYLVENWVDSFEKEILNGKTLKEVLNEG